MIPAAQPPSYHPLRSMAQDPTAPLCDPARLLALRRSGLLDTPPEEVFDRLTRLARAVTRAPVSTLTLIDATREFYKSASGFADPDIREGSLHGSFCRHVVADGSPLVVCDARTDARVNGEPHGERAYLGVPLRDGDGYILGTLCVADTEPREWTAGDLEALEGLAAAAAAEVALRRELGERRRAESALAHERGFGLQVMSALGQGIAVLTAHGEVEYANPAFLRMLGSEADDVLRRTFWDFALPPDRNEVRGVHILALAGERQGREIRMHRHDGALLHAYVAGAPRVDSAGVAVGTLLTISNVSGRRQAEQALSEAEERFRRLSEASEEGIVIHDQGWIVDANLAAAQLLGYDTDPPLEGHHMLDVIAPEAREIASRHMDDGAQGSYEAILLRRDGTHVPARLRGRPIQFHGRTARVVTIRDLSEQHVMERLKDEFVSMVSHELRTPLTSLRGSLGLLASGKLNVHQAQRMLEVAVQNTDRLVRLINDILDVERIESGQVAMDVRPVPAAELLRQAAESVRGLAEKGGTRIELMAGGIAVMADTDRIVQVLVNLLSNAIKFSPGASLVRASVEARGGEAVFRVLDFGRGIPEDKLGLIFERFQQVDASDSRKLGGTGLGLAICRSIVQQHRGRIWVDSEFGTGSTFFFTLPIARPPAEAAE